MTTSERQLGLRSGLYGGRKKRWMPAFRMVFLTAASFMAGESCQRRSKNIPAWRLKDIPRAWRQLVPIVHGKAPSDRSAANHVMHTRARTFFSNLLKHWFLRIELFAVISTVMVSLVSFQL